MRATLIFPPRTSPTYVPLGISCLAAVAKQANESLELFDANLELWNHLCDSHADLGEMRTFLKGPVEAFLNPQAYLRNWSRMGNGKFKITRLEQLARNYLAGEGLSEELAAFTARQSTKITRNTPELIAFSVMYLEQLPFALALAKYLNEEIHANVPIVLGGAAMSALSPHELLNATPFVDAILTGEGEIPFVKLLSGSSWQELPGCFFRNDEGIRFAGKNIAPEKLESLPFPSFDQLPLHEYFNPVPVLPVYGCRGCKWRRCRFCVHNHSFGRHRELPPVLLAQEMREKMIYHNCHHFYIVDQYVDPVYLDGLSDAILAMGLHCRFQIMARTIAEYTPELLQKAARAGCCWISWGMESGSQKLLDLMNKGTRVDTSLEVIRNAADAGISNLLMMIFGAPGSDAGCLNETFDFLGRAWEHIDGMTASAFVLFDQTAFSRNASFYGLEILGDHTFLNLQGVPLHDMKLRFRRTQEEGNEESPLAAREIELWERRKAWLPELPFHGRLCCEHYLIYANRTPSSTRPLKGLRGA